MISAAAPETTAAACDVPLPRNSVLLTSPHEPYTWSINESGSRRLTMWAPGATNDGFLQPAVPQPLAENLDTVSSPSASVPIGSDAPTAMSYGSYAGSASPGAPFPFW